MNAPWPALGALALAFCVACKARSGGATGGAASASASGAAAASAALGAGAASSLASARAPPLGAFAGDWSGTYVSRRHAVELDRRHGGLRVWESGSAEAGIGSGHLALHVGSDGAVTGTIDGALGTLSVVGESAAEGLTARFSGNDAKCFSGTLTTRPEGANLAGFLAASSADSTLVRDGDVKLERAKP